MLSRIMSSYYGFVSRLPRIESRALKYGYSNARVKAMKGMILRSNALEEMIKVGSIEAMVELLQRTNYKNDLAAASVNYSGSLLIENAASRGFARLVRKLIKIAPKSDKKALKVLLARWDLMNIKTLINARRLGMDYDQTRPLLFDIGGLSEDDFKEILKTDNLLKELGKTELGSRFISFSRQDKSGKARGIRAGTQDDKSLLTKIEGEMDSYIYLFMDNVLSEVGGKDFLRIREIIRKEIDAKNVMIIERLKAYGAPREKIIKSLIRGGTLNKLFLDKIIECKDLAHVMTIISSRFYNIKEKEGSLYELEIALEKSIAAQKVLAFRSAMLSAGVIIGFLLLKEEEINNLRKIAKGKEFGLSESEVRSMLVVA